MWPQWGGWGDLPLTEHDDGGPGSPWGGGGWQDWAPWFGGDQFPDWLGKDKGKRLGWLAQMLPYLQAYQQSGQWGQEFDWRKQADLWSQGFQGEQFDWQQAQDLWSRGMQEQMWGGEEAGRLWGQEFQQEQLEWQKESEGARLQQESEAANLAAFGRRWKPSTRWT